MPKSINRFEYDVLRAMLREKRVASGLTQVDVSLRMGRSQSFVSDVERGVRRVDILELHDLSELFGVRLTKFCAEFERRIATIATPPGKTRSTKRQARSKAGSSRSRPSKRRSTRP